MQRVWSRAHELEHRPEASKTCLFVVKTGVGVDAKVDGQTSGRIPETGKERELMCTTAGVSNSRSEHGRLFS